jgi:outer membrane protein OmpA-like peptidoglycan-associated protein
MTSSACSSRRWPWGAFAIACLPCVAVRAADSSQQDRRDGVVSDQQIEQALQTPHSRGLTLRPTAEPAARAPAEPPRSIDLSILFEFNSSDLQPQAAAQLEQLHAALTSQSLLKDRFVIAGHTDATGGAQYNRKLSQRRAEAVKRFLVAEGVEAGRLDTVGYGAEQLLAPDRPADPRNRRVEIRNLGEIP